MNTLNQSSAEPVKTEPTKSAKTSPYICRLYESYLRDVSARNTEVAASLTLAHILQETAVEVVQMLALPTTNFKKLQDFKENSSQA